MARIRPTLTDDQLRQLPSAAEAAFYRACRDQLPAEFLVLHSLDWVALGTSGRPRDGEADFVVFHPNAGLLAIEVKGGGVGHDPKTGEWWSVDASRDRHTIKNPFRQATASKHSLLAHLRREAKRRGRTLDRMPTGHAVLLPNISDPQPLAHLACSPREILGGAPDLHRLGQWLVDVAAYWRGQDPALQALGPAGMQLVEDILCEEVTVRPLVSAQLADEEVIRIRLTRQQARMLRMLGGRKRAVICGGAGTGKTLLALEEARRLAEDGVSTLLLCYNRPLADHLVNVARNLPNLKVRGFHQLCHERNRQVKESCGRDLLVEAARQFPGQGEFEVHYPFVLALSAELVHERFGAVIVDEGQDFSDDFWLAVESLLVSRTEGRLLLFLDHNQAVYDRSACLPVNEEPFVLSVNCRNTRFIHDAAYQYYRGEETEAPELTGVTPGILAAPTAPEQAKAIHQCINDLITKERVSPSDIAILVADHPKDLYFGLVKSLPLVAGAKWSIGSRDSNRSIWIDTVHRFKGLESSIVFLWAIDEVSADRNRETLYVGLSRAKSRLYLVGTDAACQRLVGNGAPPS